MGESKYDAEGENGARHRLVEGAGPGDPAAAGRAGRQCRRQLDGRLSVSGWYSGVAQDSEDTLNFAVLKGVRPIIETYPLEQAKEAWQHQAKATLRIVLQTQPQS